MGAWIEALQDTIVLIHSLVLMAVKHFQILIALEWTQHTSKIIMIIFNGLTK